MIDVELVDGPRDGETICISPQRTIEAVVADRYSRPVRSMEADDRPLLFSPEINRVTYHIHEFYLSIPPFHFRQAYIGSVKQVDPPLPSWAHIDRSLIRARKEPSILKSFNSWFLWTLCKLEFGLPFPGRVEPEMRRFLDKTSLERFGKVFYADDHLTFGCN